MAGTPISVIFLAGLDYAVSGYQTSAINGIRAIWDAFGHDHTFGDARKLVDQFQEHPTEKLAIYASTDKAGLQKAAEDAVDAHQGAAVFEVDPEDLSLPDPGADGDSEDMEAGPFSAAAYETSMALIAAEDGNPTAAYLRASQLARVTGDLSLYEEVQAAILHVFPLTPNGPGMRIFGFGE